MRAQTTDATQLSVGVVGLGAMGGTIAANLLERRFLVTGVDVEPARVERLVALGGRVARSPAELANQVDVTILSLPTEKAFAAVAIADDGLVAGAWDGLIVVETSTLPIALKERGRAALAARGATLLDCPLSGTGDQALTRDLVVLVSGDRTAANRCEPVFDGFARARAYLGSFGTGSKVKFVANMLVAIHNVAAAEGLSLARAADLDLEQTLSVVADGAGGSRMLEVRGPKMIAGDYGTGVRTRVFQKDLAIIANFAAELGVATPLLDACAQLYERSAAAGYGDDDTAAVYEVLRRMGRTTVGGSA
jgi:L-threonate 2-dehydrogenase